MTTIRSWLFGRASGRKTASHFSWPRSVSVAALCAPIRFYRYFISPLMPPSCGFQPTCSTYALQAIQLHGPIKGLGLTVRRLLRCHPIRWLGGSSGFDPVPPRKVHIHE